MSNLLNLTDAINEGYRAGKTPTFVYNGTTYEFSPAGLISFMAAEGDFASGTQVANITDASEAHALNSTFSDTEVEAALDALGEKINSIIAALEAFGIAASS